MAGITSAQAEEQLAAWLEASLKVAGGQEYEIGGRKLRRADLGLINEQIKYWDGMVRRLSGTSRRVYTPVI